MITDEALMAEVKEGDLDKASVLYDRYSKRLYNYFVKISLDRDAGYDMMQNTFMRVIRYKHTYRVEAPFRAWIFQIARNVFSDHLRKNKVLYSDYQEVENIGETDNGESDEKNEQEKLLNKSLARLSDEAREILVMSRYQNMKYEEIAETMDLTVSAVKVKVHRAIKKLRVYYFELEKI
jgi:RNA polymerase sigma-70 factor (ECF subfamily)